MSPQYRSTKYGHAIDQLLDAVPESAIYSNSIRTSVLVFYSSLCEVIRLRKQLRVTGFQSVGTMSPSSF